MIKLDKALSQFFKLNPAYQQHGPLIVAVSGGRDSICLLHWLAHSTLISAKLIAVHIDHGVRPESAADGERFRQMAARWGVECRVEQAGLNAETFTENSGRMARYAILQDAAQQAHGRFILTGHHAGDQAETVLLHLLRGSGLTGLTGMRSQTDLPARQRSSALLRPMLTVNPADLDRYAAEHRLTPLQDPSNSDTRFTRNRVRHTLMPLLKAEFNPQIQKSLSQMAHVLQDDLAALTAIHLKSLDQADPDSGSGWATLDVAAWQMGTASFQRFALRHLFAQATGSTQDLTLENLESARSGLLEGKTDRRYQLSGNVLAQQAGDRLVVQHSSAVGLFDLPQLDAPDSEIEINPQQATRLKLKDGGWHMHISPINLADIDLTQAAENRWVAFLAIEPNRPLTLRGRLTGETFRPLGFDGDVSLKKLMIDRKIPAVLRQAWPILADENGPLWIAGHRLAQRAAITDKTTFAIKFILEKTQ